MTLSKDNDTLMAISSNSKNILKILDYAERNWAQLQIK